MEPKKADWWARVLSVVAIIVSAGSAWVSYDVSVAARIEATRPRLTVEAEIAKFQTLPGHLSVEVTATNGGVSPAREVRAIARIIITNAPRYAFDTFRRSVGCQNLPFTLKPTLYPGKHTSEIFSFDLSKPESLMNTQQYYQSGIDMIINEKPGLVLLGCILFSMDGVEPPFIEPIFQKLEVLCGVAKRQCEIPVRPKPDEVMQYNLNDPL